MNLQTEQDLIDYGRKIGEKLTPPAVIELIGDVGAGKTTFTRGLAEGLGVKESITSPSFTIAKRYAYNQNGATHYLTHYDFYRLADPGLMSEDLAESISDQDTIVVLEWAETVADILPENRLTYEIRLNDDGSRSVKEQTNETLS